MENIKYIWIEGGETVFDLYLVEDYVNGNSCLAVLSYDERTDLWQLDSDITGFNTVFINEMGMDVKTLSLEFVIEQCDNMCNFYQRIKSKLID